MDWRAFAISVSNEKILDKAVRKSVGSEGSVRHWVLAKFINSMRPEVRERDLTIRPCDIFKVKSVKAAVVSGPDSESP